MLLNIIVEITLCFCADGAVFKYGERIVDDGMQIDPTFGNGFQA